MTSRSPGFTLLCSLALLSTATVPVGCSSFSEDCGNTGECFPAGAGGDGSGGTGADGGRGGATSGSGSGADSGAGGNGPACDANASPSDEACVVDEAHAIFAAPSGDDAAAGTREAPVATLGRAVALASEESKIVIACAGAFDEHLVLEDGARIYGGFACPESADPWTYDGAAKTRVTPSATGPALEIRGVAAPVVLEDLVATAADAVAPGESSIAAFVVGSEDVTLRRVALVAGVAMRGADGALEPYEFPAPVDLSGQDGTDVSGGLGAACECPDGTTSRRGAGGAPPNQSGAGGLPDYDGPGGEEGLASGACTGASAGGSGSDGAAGSPAALARGATSFGAVVATGWSPGSGADGGDGSPGQGGGGGAGKNGGGGGSGGCGGCGGKGGGGGQGGGASIGLLVLDATVVGEVLEVIATDAGDGGDGAGSQQGQAVAGAGGNGFGGGSDRGCAGGNGGPGGAGGPGGGGAGGLSVAVLHSGEAPVLTDVAMAFGTPGAQGLGGGVDGDAGIDGIAQEVLELP